MILGTDVSNLSTTATTAAAQGLSIVVPLYNEAAGLAFLHERLGKLATTLRQRYGIGCEVVYVDDGSADTTLGIARALKADALDIQVVSLSRNFGKEAALMAGLDHARLGAVLFMDGDGQHPPDLVLQLVDHWVNGGHDVVYTAKANRDNEPFMRRLAVHGGGGVRAFDPVGGLHHRQAGSRLAPAGGRPDDDRRCSAHHDRQRRRIYRQDPVRAEGASDLFRRRTQPESLRVKNFGRGS